jgi:phosphoribosyl 1,2-cyclic phosphodiesterase
MPVRFTVLASGSRGNASLLDVDGFGILLDVGLGPRQFARRLTEADASWETVRVVLLTHTHTDHWNDRTFAHLLRRRIPVHCHAVHSRVLRSYSPAFARLRAEKLVRTYNGDELTLGMGVRCRPIPVRHDGGPTFGFRFDGVGNLFDRSWALGYVADLGSWDTKLARALSDVDLLALEFNHDVELEESSGRSRELIARVVGDAGHLSNAQAAALLREVIRLSDSRRPRHVVQLHLSRDCNRPTLATETARQVLAELGDAIQLHAARQDASSPTFSM